MDYHNYYDKKQNQRSMGLPFKSWDCLPDPAADERYLQAMYIREWTNEMSFKTFKRLFLRWEKSNSKKHFYEWVARLRKSGGIKKIFYNKGEEICI